MFGECITSIRTYIDTGPAPKTGGSKEGGEV